MADAKLSKSEIEERTQMLRKFRQALVRQRERFRRYLELLESGSHPDGADEIRVDMEKSIVREIATFEQVIEPLEVMYREHDPEASADIPNLRAALQRTRNEVVRRTELNRDILRQQIDTLRREISGLRIMRRHSRLYSAAPPTTIDISA